MQSLNRRGRVLLKVFAVLIVLALLTLSVMSLPASAAVTEEIWEQDGNIILTPQAAKDLLLGLRELSAENEVLRSTLETERTATQELITAVQGLRAEIQKERQLSQETIALLQKQVQTERARTRTVGIIGVLVTVLAIAL